MNNKHFESILDICCLKLTQEARERGFSDAHNFETRVRDVLASLTEGTSVHVDFDTPPQGFPDIVAGRFGVEVKFTLADTWRSVANSIQETQRAKCVEVIYLVFGKMGGVPEVRWGHYDQSVVHVRTSHVPRFEVELPKKGEPIKQSLFDQMGISYDDFRVLEMKDKMRYIRAYAKKLHPDGRLWWLEGMEEHTLPSQVRLYTKLTMEEKIRLRAEAALLCPEIVQSGRVRAKYDNAVLFLLTYHGVLCHQARDLFSAGSVANPQNDDKGGVYIARALKLLEQPMIEAAQSMDDALFKEYWGECVPYNQRISRWLEKADALATDWTPSKTLFVNL